MSKVMVIGIDGLDRKYIQDHLFHLPNFRKIIEKSPPINSTSVFPPDSDTAWSTIYTGLNPAKHGVVDFVDPLERAKVIKKESEYSYVEAFRGKTFWDIVGNHNKKVCVIYPHMANPVWDVNGFMINTDPQTGAFQYTPHDYKFNFDISNFKSIKRIPRTKSELKKFLENKTEVILKEFQFALNMQKSDSWDLFFFYSSTIDTLMHIFWNYCDKNDPTYPGPNQFENVILDLHKLYDSQIWNLINHIDDNTTVLIISDHGHARRPVKLLNVNELLRRNGFLSTKDGSGAGVLTMVERAKRIAVDIAQKSGMRPAAQTILRMIPSIKKMYTKPMNIDFSKTLAHCTDLSGMKAYSYGGIRVYRDKFSNDVEFQNALDSIIEKLSKVTLPDSERKVFQWIKRREEYYDGPFINKYPELIFNLVDDYGAGWSVKTDIWDVSSAHKFFPGSHRGSTPVFYLYNYKKSIKRNVATLEDIYPTVLKLIDVPFDEKAVDGKSLI